MTEPGKYPQLSFAIGNPDAPDTIYVSDDPSVNDLTLTIATNRGATFEPGTPVPLPSAPKGKGSLLYLDLSNLDLTAAEFAALEFAADGWEFKPYPDPQLVCMTPTAEVTLEPGTGNLIRISVKQFAMATPPAGAAVDLRVTYYRVDGVTSGNIGVPSYFQASLQLPSSGEGDLHDAIEADVLQPFLVNSIDGYLDVRNQISLKLSPSDLVRKVEASADTRFTITFVYAGARPGFGALCTGREAARIRVSPGPNAGEWTITSRGDEENPSWELRPPAGKPILGSGVQSVVAFLIEDIVTTLEPGPTLLLVGYTGVPGYDDGSYQVLLEKVPHVRIKSFYAEPNPVPLTGGSGEVTLKWEVEDGGSLTLISGPLYKDVTGMTEWPEPIDSTRAFTLQADGESLANLGNRAFEDLLAEVAPSINSFDAAPTARHADDAWPGFFQLSWNVGAKGKVELSGSRGDITPGPYPPQDQRSFRIEGPEMVTLAPEGKLHDPLRRRSVVLSAFRPEVSQWPVAAAPGFVATAPGAGYVVVSSPTESSVTALDAFTWKPIGDPVPVGDAPAGIAFAPDGSALYVASTSTRSVTAIAVTVRDGVPQYEFTPIGSTEVDGTPRQIAVSPDGRHVYVTVDRSPAGGHLAVLAFGEGGVLELVAKLPVGDAPRGVAISPSGARVFVANSAADSVTAIVAKRGRWQVLEQPITGLGSTPTGLALAAAGKLLLVACAGSNRVVAVDVESTSQKALDVGTKPAQVEVVPGGAYALVSNEGDGTVSFIRLGATPDACAVLGDPVSVGPGPNGIAVSEDGGFAAVATSGHAKLGVIALSTYEQVEGPLPDVGGQPTDVAVAPDGTRAVAWHDTFVTLKPGTPSKGVFVYELDSQTVAHELSGEEVGQFLFAPGADATRAYVLKRGARSIQVIDTGTWSEKCTIELTGGGAGAPRALDVSADGRRLFVLTLDAQYVGTLFVFDVDTAKDKYAQLAVVTVFTASQRPRALLCAAVDGRGAYVVNSSDQELWVVSENDEGTWAVEPDPVRVEKRAHAIAGAPDGARLYLLNRGGDYDSISAVDVRARHTKTAAVPEDGAALNGLVVSPDGNRLFVSDPTKAGVRVIDAASLRPVQTIDWSGDVGMPWGIAVSPDGARVFTANALSENLAVARQVQPAVPASALSAADDFAGLFLRHYLGQSKPNEKKAGWTDSPDIYPAGKDLLKDPDELDTQKSYDTQSPNKVFINTENYVYIRGKSKAPANPAVYRVWFYYVDANLVLWPDNWENDRLTPKFMEVTAESVDQIVHTMPPFTWKPYEPEGVHWCMIAIAEGPELSDPPESPKPKGYMQTWDWLGEYIVKTPNLAWKNTVSVDDRDDLDKWTALSPAKDGGEFGVGFRCRNMPIDGSFDFIVPGPTQGRGGSLNQRNLVITNPDESRYWTLQWPADAAESTATVRWRKGATNPDPGAEVTIIITYEAERLVGRVPDPLRGADRLLRENHDGRLEPVLVHVLGSASFIYDER